MSFYQPSLSLYDVLSALNDQASVVRDPRERLLRGQGYGIQPSTYGSYGGLGSALPSGLFYKLAGDACYYRPDYYYTGEDEEDLAEEEQELEDAERAARALEQQKDESEQVPSYYHSRAPKGGVETLEDFNPLSGLLSAVPLGGTPSYSAVPLGIPGGGIVDQENLLKRALAQQAQAENGIPAAMAGAPAPEEDGQKPEQAKDKPEKLTPTGAKGRLPFPLKSQKSSSGAGGPLQVSKPESRLDLPFSPEVNVYDCPDQYVVAAALPGATSKAFKLDYHPSTHELILKGDIVDRLGIGEEFLKVTELKYGAFQRIIKFPITPRIKDEEIKASFRNGILQVRVPKQLETNQMPASKKRILIEDVPDEELEYEEHPSLPL